MKLRICEYDGGTCVIADEKKYYDKRMKHVKLNGYEVEYDDKEEGTGDIGRSSKSKGKKGYVRQFKARDKHNRIPKKQRVHRLDKES